MHMCRCDQGVRILPALAQRMQRRDEMTRGEQCSQNEEVNGSCPRRRLRRPERMNRRPGWSLDSNHS